MNINRASNLLDPGQSALVLFTREPLGGQNDKSYIEPDGSGWSGHWADIESYSPVDIVIIYYRPPKPGSHYGEIFTANYEDTVASPLQNKYRGRFLVKFQDLKQVGTTNQTWPDFSGKGQKPTGRIPLEYGA